MEDTTRLQQQLQFALEADRLKHVLRRTWLTDQSRLENSAEHSWHLALMAILLAEYAAQTPLDLLKVLKMLLVHDIVEIDAGDTYIYDDVAARDKAQREQAAARRIFHLLPEDQARDLRQLWEEFEARRSAEARFAAALDRLQPLLHNYHTQGRAWHEHAITRDTVEERNRQMMEGAPALWEFAKQLIADAAARGYLPVAPEAPEA